jgi:hypothetical protein
VLDGSQQKGRKVMNRKEPGFQNEGKVPTTGLQSFARGLVYSSVSLLLAIHVLASDGPITVSDVQHQGQGSFKVATASATYIFHKQGAGFAGLIDKDGKDWISYRPGGGSAGEYRGIPNCGQCFHPGYTNSTSRLIRAEAKHVTIEAETLDKGYRCQWDIFSDCATFTLLKTGTNYWFLYEGTPGGKLEEARQFMVRSTGEKTPLSQVWSQDIPVPEWLYFADRTIQRSLLLIHHEDDDIVDQYWPMEGNMTVFGFGRKYKTTDRYLTKTPARFTIALCESLDFDTIRRQARSLLSQ